MTNSVSSNDQRSTTLQLSSLVLGELSWDLNRPTSSEWCMPMNLISMRVRLIV